MLELLSGILLGLSLAAPPGPVSALMADATLRRGVGRGVRVGLGATTADFAFFLLAWAGAVAVLERFPLVRAFLALAGALLMAFYGYGAWRSARDPADVDALAPATFVTGLVAAGTSPFNLAWWIGPGSSLIASLGLTIVVGLFAGVLLWVVTFPTVLAHAGRRVPDLQRWVAYASALVLAGFAAWLGWTGANLLGTASS